MWGSAANRHMQTLRKLLAGNLLPAASGLGVAAVTAAYNRHSFSTYCDEGEIEFSPRTWYNQCAASSAPSPAKAKVVSSVDTSPKTLQHVIYSDLMHRRREIFLTGTIDEKMTQDAIAQMLYLERLEPGKPITLIINSGGGKVSAGLALHDLIQEMTSPVHTVCLGRCMSMAAVLLASGEKGFRCASANCRVMIHDPHVLVQGSKGPKSIAKTHAQIERSRTTLCRLLADYTGLSYEKVEALLEEEYYMDAEEAKELGIIDHVGCSLVAVSQATSKSIVPSSSGTATNIGLSPAADVMPTPATAVPTVRESAMSAVVAEGGRQS